MHLAHLLLAATLGGPAAEVSLAPAPGAPPVSTVEVEGTSVALDGRGRGRIARGTAPSADGLLFYRTAPESTGGEQVFYYPSEWTLVTWPLRGVAGSSAAEIVVKDHGVETWENARSHEAPLEPGETKRSVRFALPPGAWDVAILAPGWAPGFAVDVLAQGTPLDLEASPLERAGRVKARILDARSGKPPDRWNAYVSRVGADPEREESKFFEKRPISGGRTELDFASLPVGGWELKIQAAGRSEPHLPVKIPKAGALADLGDVYVTDFGKLRVVLVFPSDVPPGRFEVKLTRSRLEFGAAEIELGSRTVAPQGDVTLEFEAIEPGAVEIECENADQHIRRNDSAVVEANRTAEARIVVRPVMVHGTVRHGDKNVVGAEVSGPLGNASWGKPKPFLSDELGAYELETWGGTETLVLSTLPPGHKISFTEILRVDPEASEIAHDVVLPGAEIRGVVRDAETGNIIAGAEVQFETAIEQENPPDPDNYTTFMLGMDSDEEGRFRLGNLDDRPIDVTVTHEEYSAARFPSVRPTPEGTELDVRLERGLGLSGTVVDESGVPVQGATVGLDVDAQGMDFVRTATTSANGRYHFADVGSGVHTLGLFPCGRTLVLRQFTVSAAESADGRGHVENIQFVPEATPLTVRVEDASGSPSRNAPVRWAINGATLPLSPWWGAARRCGISDSTSVGEIVLHGFPFASITALSLWSQAVYGTFTHDGSQTVWTIRLPEEKHLEAEQQAAR